MSRNDIIRTLMYSIPAIFRGDVFALVEQPSLVQPLDRNNFLRHLMGYVSDGSKAIMETCLLENHPRRYLIQPLLLPPHPSHTDA